MRSAGAECEGLRYSHSAWSRRSTEATKLQSGCVWNGSRMLPEGAGACLHGFPRPLPPARQGWGDELCGGLLPSAKGCAIRTRSGFAGYGT